MTIVALGVGDAGLPALKRFLIALGENPGLCVVVVQHALPGADPSLLAQFTDLQVSALKPGDRPVVDHVLVAPPEVAVELVNGQWQLHRSPEPSERRTIIDRLFRSLAGSAGARAIGVVLPGTGRDGALGAQAIARAGGTTIAVTPVETGEAPETTDDPRFSMLQSALASGGVTQVLSPFQAAQALVQHRQQLQTAAPSGSEPAPHDSREQTPSSHNEPAPADLDAAPEPERALPPAASAATADLARENAELRRQNQQLFNIHGRLQSALAEVRNQLDELHTRYKAVATARAELSSLLSGSSLALLLLDERMRVQGYGGDIGQIYTVGPEDIGKPVVLLAHHAHEIPTLPPVQELLRDPDAHEADVVTSDRWYLRRVLVRKPTGTAPFGLLIVFIDVTKLKHTEASAQPDDEWVRTLTDASPSVISYVDEAIARYLT
ncbi:MAG: chemotaxis protein CheB [Polyangiales bacterium]